MSKRYEKLKSLLKELFQLNQPDLDFGLYRIMHAKSAEVSQFLDNELLPQIKKAFSNYRFLDKAYLEKELSEAVRNIEKYEMSPEEVPFVQRLRARLSTDAVDFDALESEVYDHLYSFFRRYYSEGDYIAKRVYKPGVYSVPYEGQEVTLHWANKDQYYIKTSEYLRDYAFRLKPEDEENPMRVHFRLTDCTEGEHSNIKPTNGNERMFILQAKGESDNNFILEESDGANQELVIKFNFRPSTRNDWPEEERPWKSKPPTQKEHIDLAVRRILSINNLSPWITELGKLHVSEDGKKSEYTQLESHLRRYAARNTFDFFIHKDLDTYLRQELDFYIKSEVMYLEDVEDETILRVEQYLSKVKIIRIIAGKIIDFLVQIEEFQKKLWLKKKFVVQTNYCITTGCIPKEFYPEIAENEAQREEWIALFSIDKMNGDLVTPGYSGKLSPEFLNAYPTLVVDTRHFSRDFTERLLEAVGDTDDQTDGILFHTENFQALSFMQKRYQDKVKCIYIDPPYNTEKDRSLGKFLYKDGLDYSSWLTMMDGRIHLSQSLLTQEGCLFVSIDDTMYSNLFLQLSDIFGHSNHIATIIWEKVHTRKNSARFFSVSHDYVPCFARNKHLWDRVLLPREGVSAYSNPDGDPRGPWKPDPVYANNPYDADYVITTPNGIKLYPPSGQYWRLSESTWKDKVASNSVVWGKGDNYPMIKRYLADVQDGLVPITLFKRTFAGDNARANSEFNALFGSGRQFIYPKPTLLIKRLIGTNVRTSKEEVVLDYFAGSGTTGHAVINLNREDQGHRKFILVEMGDYFDTVLLPRLKKVTFSPEWKDGKPLRYATPEEASRSPRIMKILRLESYEDVLNNLKAVRSESQQSFLDNPEAQGVDGFREQYILKYMLDVETRGSQSLLNIQAFADPYAYKLNVKQPGSDESRLINVDLIETFNWLIGLTVVQIGAQRSFVANFIRDSEKRLCLDDGLRKKENGHYWFRTVTGITPDGQQALIIWRKLTGEPEQDNLVLDEWFTQDYLDKESEFDIIWVNGGNNLENLKSPTDLWRVRLIEEDFHRLMFDTEKI